MTNMQESVKGLVAKIGTQEEYFIPKHEVQAGDWARILVADGALTCVIEGLVEATFGSNDSLNVAGFDLRHATVRVLVWEKPAVPLPTEPGLYAKQEDVEAGLATGKLYRLRPERKNGGETGELIWVDAHRGDREDVEHLQRVHQLQSLVRLGADVSSEPAPAPTADTPHLDKVHPSVFADEVLDEHCIQAHWTRNRAQIRALIVEGIEKARGQR